MTIALREWYERTDWLSTHLFAASLGEFLTGACPSADERSLLALRVSRDLSPRGNKYKLTEREYTRKTERKCAFFLFPFLSPSSLDFSSRLSCGRRRRRFTSSLRGDSVPSHLFFLLSFLLSSGRPRAFPCAGRGGGCDSRVVGKLNWSFDLRRNDSNLRIPHHFRATMPRQERIAGWSLPRLLWKSDSYWTRLWFLVCSLQGGILIFSFKPSLISAWSSRRIIRVLGKKHINFSCKCLGQFFFNAFHYLCYTSSSHRIFTWLISWHKQFKSSDVTWMISLFSEDRR